MATLDNDLAEYDALTSDVAAATYDTFRPNLQRWFDFIEEKPAFVGVVARLERDLDFQTWWERTSEGDEYGNTVLAWPKGSDNRLGMQLKMFRAFLDGKPDVLGFHMAFLRSTGSDRFDDMLSDVRQQVFDPMTRDLRRRFAQADEAKASDDIPASDRVVNIDHNGPAFAEAITALDSVAELVRSANDYDDDADREQQLAELAASKGLVASARVRATAAIELLAKCLQYLMKKFADSAIGFAAGVAFKAFGKLTNLW